MMGPTKMPPPSLPKPVRRVLDWWHAPHFLAKTSVIVETLEVASMIIWPPNSPAQMLVAFAWLVLVAALPFAPRVLCVAGLLLSLITTRLPGQEAWNTGVFAVFGLFLTVGYVMPRWAAIALPVGFSALDAAGFVWFGAGSLGGTLIQGVIDGLNGIQRDAAVESGVMLGADAASLPQYATIVFVSTLVLDLMVLGFLTMCSAAFRRTAAAGERAARAEQLLGRVTREQQLAHMIHDSVANDMSTIAMLAWRAKAAEDDSQMLDAIYARSHHALDRVHEVIDVLNGRRDLAELEGEGATGVSGSVGHVGADTDADARGDSVGDVSFDIQVEKYVEDQDRTMRMLGLAGVSRFNSVSDAVVSKPSQRAVMGLLEEVYANIVRHCAMGEMASVDAMDGTLAPDEGEGEDEGEPAYNLFVDIGHDRIRISEVNALADERHTLVHGRKHGSGLALHRDVIESLGGTLNTSRQDGTWMLSADIPV